MASDGGLVPLHEAIVTLRDELTAAMAQGEESLIRFDIERIDLKLSAAVTEAAGGGLGIKWWLVNASVEGRLERSSTQEITLTIVPLNIATGDRLSIADDD